MKFSKQMIDVDEEIKAQYDEIKEWHQDEKGYFLIRVKEEIEAAYTTNNHVIKKVIRSDKANKIYMTIIRKGLVTRLDHAAYLGKELMKAQIALENNLRYTQDSFLNIHQMR